MKSRQSHKPRMKSKKGALRTSTIAADLQGIQLDNQTYLRRALWVNTAFGVTII